MRSPVAELLAELGQAFDSLGISWFTDADFIAQTRVLPVVHLPTGLPVDTVIAGPGLEEEFLQRPVVQSIDGVLGQSDLLAAFEQCGSRAQVGRQPEV